MELIQRGVGLAASFIILEQGPGTWWIVLGFDCVFIFDYLAYSQNTSQGECTDAADLTIRSHGAADLEGRF